MIQPKNTIPPNAKLVFKGVLFEVWQWEQNMYDGSIQIFERVKRLPGSQVIATVEDKIIIEIQEQPDNSRSFCSLPSGGSEEGEEPLEAAKRELLEETGYESNEWILWKEHNPVRKMEWTVYTFIARNCVWKQGQKLDGGEKIETRLITFDEFLLLGDNSDFHGRSLVPFLIRGRLDVKYKEELRKTIFG